MHHRHFVLLFIPLLCFALIVGGAHGSPFPRCKKAYDETEDDHNPLFPKIPRCRQFDLECSILVFACCLVSFLAASACAVCYAMYNKRQQRQKLVPCDAYCTCPAHANHSPHFATRLESA